MVNVNVKLNLTRVKKPAKVNSLTCLFTNITNSMGPTWGPPGSCRPQMGPMLAPWTLLLQHLWSYIFTLLVSSKRATLWLQVTIWCIIKYRPLLQWLIYMRKSGPWLRPQRKFYVKSTVQLIWSWPNLMTPVACLTRIFCLPANEKTWCASKLGHRFHSWHPDVYLRH